jgi:voltage-gated potassium channel
MNIERRQRAFDSLERATELPMLLLALAIIPLFVAPLATDLSNQVAEALYALELFIWAAFALELVAKTYLAPHRVQYLRRHWFDVVIVVVPFLRPLRVARSARALRLLRLVRALAAVTRVVHQAQTVLDSHGLKYVLLLAGAIILGSAGLVALLEADSGGTITDFDDALWWAMTTVTTVGYGDKFPVTPEGKAIAVFLMVLGITVFSLLTANIAAFLVRPKGESGATLDDVLAKLERVEAQLAELRMMRDGAGRVASRSALLAAHEDSLAQVLGRLQPVGLPGQDDAAGAVPVNGGVLDAGRNGAAVAQGTGGSDQSPPRANDHRV